MRDKLTILASQEFRKRPSVTTGHGHFFQDAFLSSLGTVFTVIYQIKTYTLTVIQDGKIAAYVRTKNEDWAL